MAPHKTKQSFVRRQGLILVHGPVLQDSVLERTGIDACM